jgi:hypothetical protein
MERERRRVFTNKIERFSTTKWRTFYAHTLKRSTEGENG